MTTALHYRVCTPALSCQALWGGRCPGSACLGIPSTPPAGWNQLVGDAVGGCGWRLCRPMEGVCVWKAYTFYRPPLQINTCFVLIGDQPSQGSCTCVYSSESRGLYELDSVLPCEHVPSCDPHVLLVLSPIPLFLFSRLAMRDPGVGVDMGMPGSHPRNTQGPHTYHTWQ
jgi:hypothetical protein